MLFHEETNKSTPTPSHPSVMVSFREIEQSGLQSKITGSHASKAPGAGISAKLSIGSFPSAAVQKILRAPGIERFRSGESSGADIKHLARLRLRLGSIGKFFLGLRQKGKAEKQDCYDDASHKASFTGLLVSALQVVRHLGGALFCREKLSLSGGFSPIYYTRAAAISFLVLSYCLIPSAFAQTPTVVTGTVLDGNGLPYVNAKVSAQLVGVPPTQTATILVNGIPVQIGGQQNGNANASGVFSMNLFCNSAGGGCSVISPPGTQWQITINTEGERPPFGTGSQTCTATVTITGASQDLSTNFNACPLLTKNIPSGAGGLTGQAQVNNAGAIAGTSCETFLNLATGPVNVNCDWHSKGPNPYIDATAFGVRAVNPNVAPAQSGITATTTAGQSTVPISSASTFVNGDGAVVQGAGAANGLGPMGTVTVTPTNGRVGTNTGDGVAAPAGATAYNYKAFACNAAGGCTAPSAVGSTATGAASLGSQTIVGVTATRSNDTWTYTTGSAPPFSAGIVITVSAPTAGVADADFEGQYLVTTTTGTGFTVAGAPLDTRDGARTASIGSYTVTYYNYNQVTWSAVTGSPFRYFVCSDRATPGTYHVLGPARLPVNPTSSSFTEGTLEFDDFGATMMAASASVVPWYISDSNCTGAATPNNWVTTIASGAGTTSLTMSGNAPGSVSGKTIRFDNTPNAITAAAAAAGVGVVGVPLEFPFSAPGTAYVFNSVWDDSGANATLMLPQGLTLNDTVLFGNNGGQMYGDRLPGSAPVQTAASKSVPAVTVNAYPGVFVTNGFATTIQGLAFNAPNNGIAVLQDGGGGNLGSTFIDDQFDTGATSTDFMGIAFVCRGGPGADCRASFKGKNLMIAGTQAMGQTSYTPSFFCDICATSTFDDLMGSARALVVFSGANGGGSTLQINVADWQGGSTPFVSFGIHGAGGQYVANIKFATLDTMAQPCVAFLAGGGSVNVGQSCVPSSGIPQFVGQRASSIGSISTGQNRDVAVYAGGAVRDGVFCVTNCSGSFSTQQSLSMSQRVGPAHSAFIDALPMAAPTCSVSAGGTKAIGTYNFTVSPVWQGNAESLTSLPSATCTTTTGNQTITVNWVIPAGNPKGTSVYANSALQGTGLSCNNTILPGSSVILTGNEANCGTPPTLSSGGPTEMMPGTQGLAAPVLILGNGIKTGNPAPTCASTGLGTGGTCGGFTAGSDDVSGAFTFTAGTTAAATGTVTLTFNTPSPGNTFCMFNLSNQNTGWATGAGIFPILGSSTNQAVWNNNGTALTNTLTYTIFYQCNRH